MDAFEQGRKNTRGEQEEKEREQARNQQNRRDTSERIFRILAPKMKGLGYAIWIDKESNNTLFISRWKPVMHSYVSSDLYFSPDYNDPKLTSITTTSGAGWRIPYEQACGLTDEQVMMRVGEYYEATKQSKADGDKYQKELKKQQEVDRRKSESDRQWEFISSNWGWGVVILIVLMVILG